MEGDSEKCLAAGMDDYLSKPFRQKDMLEILKHWLNGTPSALAREETAGKRNIERKESIVIPEKELSEKGTHVSPIDRRMLCSIQDLQIEGEPDILKTICSAYLANSEPLIATLREAVAVNDIDVLQRSSHTLKSSSANVGAMKLSEISKELEMNCRNNSMENAAKAVTAIEHEFSKVKDVLKKEVAST